MSLQLNAEFPNLQGESQLGPFSLYDYMGDSWCMITSHPADFTPVCTTEVAKVSEMYEEFESRNVKVAGLSCNSAESHAAWAADVEAVSGRPLTYPIIADEDRTHATTLGMLDETNRNAAGLPMTVRCVYIIGPDKRVKLMISYPAAVGRNYVEILRAIDALQLGAAQPVATPHGWTPGSEVMILPSVTPEQAAEQFPNHRVQDLPSGKAYMRFAPQA